jgi:hypothetical protein
MAEGQEPCTGRKAFDPSMQGEQREASKLIMAPPCSTQPSTLSLYSSSNAMPNSSASLNPAATSGRHASIANFKLHTVSTTENSRSCAGIRSSNKSSKIHLDALFGGHLRFLMKSVGRLSRSKNAGYSPRCRDCDPKTSTACPADVFTGNAERRFPSCPPRSMKDDLGVAPPEHTVFNSRGPD